MAIVKFRPEVFVQVVPEGNFSHLGQAAVTAGIAAAIAKNQVSPGLGVISKGYAFSFGCSPRFVPGYPVVFQEVKPVSPPPDKRLL
jgi:hypothetical protein